MFIFWQEGRSFFRPADRRKLRMQTPLLYLCIFVLLVSAGCSDSADPVDANQAANTAIAPVSEFTDAKLALAEGTKFLDEGETDKAIDVLNQAVKLDPDLAEAWFKLGIAYGLTERRDETIGTTDTEPTPASTGKKESKTNSEIAFERSVTAYKKIVAANNEDDVAHFNLGRAYNKLNEDQDSAKALKQAVKLKPDDNEYQTELGAILIKLAQYHEAIPPLKKALELDPENIRAQELLEDAEAGRKRVNYSVPPKDGKKPANSSTNTNTSADPMDSKPPPPPTPLPSKQRPTPLRPD